MRTELWQRAHRLWFLGAAFLALVIAPAAAQGQYDALYEHEAIAYSTSEPANAVSRLREQLASGDVTLTYDEEWGWLTSLLEALEIDPASQALVFSKTSLQRRSISPHTPRAIYFNDTTYVGYSNGGHMIEIAVADPKLGAVFYSLDLTNKKQAVLVRETDQCLACHGSATHTDGIPGFIVRSVYPDARGFPQLTLGSYHTSPQSPFAERWGGWFVTGRAGENPHLGNKQVEDPEDPERFEADCQKVATWPEMVDPADYPADTSDIVALMVLEHQVAVHNALTKARYQALRALWNEKILDDAFGEKGGGLRQSTQRRIAGAASDLAKALLCVGASRLSPGIVPDQDFAEQFASRSCRDAQGRSLRDFDLQTRLFRYPCSFLIYGEAFRQLPPALKEETVAVMTKWLREGIPVEEAPMTAADREAILEILLQTHPAFGGTPAESVSATGRENGKPPA